MPAIALSAERAPARARPRAVAAWLFAVALLVFCIVVIGGITRLTESGLSIVRWDPLSGIVPPLSDADWLAEYAAYRTSPQGVLVNPDMGVAAFKQIYFWEYLHRVIARLVVVALVLPMAGFAAVRAIPRGFGGRMGMLLGLIAIEPVFGWWMVASGLRDRPSVAPERLAVHLVTALLILSVCLWTALDLREGRRPLPRWAAGVLALLGVQIVWGAFTAGLRAGHASDTWPLMFGRLVPPLGSILDDPISVQWVHRTLAWGVAAAVIAAAWRWRAAGHRAGLVVAAVALQISLGILTIVHGVPVPLAATHQAGAVLLLAVTLWLAHWPSPSVRYSSTLPQSR